MSANILILDIETAPHKAYVWTSELRYGRIPGDRVVEPGYTLCFSFKWFRHGQVTFLRERLLDTAWELLDAADVVVHYNGRKFDIPTLEGEMIAAGMKPPSPYKQVDLCDFAKRHTRYINAKMETVCQAIGIGKKVKHKGMELWRACMEGDEKAWRIMERYNKRDVVMTNKLYTQCLPWITGHPNMAALAGHEGCPNCGSQRAHKHDKRMLAQVRLYQRYRCVSCGHVYRGRKPCS